MKRNIKKQLRKGISVLLLVGMVSGVCLNTQARSTAAETEDSVVTETDDCVTAETGKADNEEKDRTSLDDRLAIHYHINGQWEGHTNVEVELENISGEVIDDWEINFRYPEKIEKIWNAKITSRESGSYTVKNAAWNQDIPIDGKVSFGMIVAHEKEMTYPSEYYLTRECLAVEGDYTVDYKEDDHWDNYIKGRFVITNQSDHVIEDWKLTFDSNLVIKDIWNAKVLSTYETIQCIDNVTPNTNIGVGETIEFGFTAFCEGEVKIESYILDEMRETKKPKLDAEGNALPDAKHTMELDDFETLEELEAYLAQGGTVEGIGDSNKNLLRSAKAKPKTVKAKVKYQLKVDKPDAKNPVAAIQGFYRTDGKCFTMIRRDNSAILQQGTLKQNTNVYHIMNAGKIVMSGFAHGQTIDQFTVKKGKTTKDYFLLGGKADHGWSTELACIDYATIVKYKKKKDSIDTFQYSKNLTRFKQIKDLEYANMDRKKPGELDRVDGALSADGTNLVVWAKFDGNKVQVSVYNFIKIKNYLYGIGGEKKAHQTFSFKTNKSLAQGACYTSYIKNADKEEVLKPSGSFQSIEISNTITNKDKKAWHIYICGGNTGLKKPLRIARFLIKKKEKKIAGQKQVGINPLSPEGKKASKTAWEIEGCHISGDDLEFGITAYKTGKKGTQYIHAIKKNVF